MRVTSGVTGSAKFGVVIRAIELSLIFTIGGLRLLDC